MQGHEYRPWVAILAGGGGTRLWPMSRRGRPKQFQRLLPDGDTLLAATVRRLAPLTPIERVLVVTAAEQVEEVRRAVPSLPAENLVIEPVARNTAPCIGLAAVEVLRREPSSTGLPAVMAVIPSDHHVRDEPAFIAALQHATAAAAKGDVVTIGIRPTHPETGFGYIQRGAEPVGAGGLFNVERFVEKPDLPTAERYVASGEYLWNGGMFFFPAARLLDEMRVLMPELHAILDGIRAEPNLVQAHYAHARSVSIDYGVMEKLPSRPGGLRVVPGDFGWSDVGSWAALLDLLPRDSQGNATLGEPVAVEARGNVLVSSPGGPVVTVLGVDDLVVVATPEAVLVLPRARAQEVRAIVAQLETSGRSTYL